MRVENGILVIESKQELIGIIQKNLDSHSRNIDLRLISMIEEDYGYLSVKEENWICEKLKYIFRHNVAYKKYRKIKDMIFRNNGI
jgi:hypothetical protein